MEKKVLLSPTQCSFVQKKKKRDEGREGRERRRGMRLCMKMVVVKLIIWISSKVPRMRMKSNSFSCLFSVRTQNQSDLVMFSSLSMIAQSIISDRNLQM